MRYLVRSTDRYRYELSIETNTKKVFFVINLILSMFQAELNFPFFYKVIDDDEIKLYKVIIIAMRNLLMELVFFCIYFPLLMIMD